MAVFTFVSRDALARWLARYDIGDLVEHEGIASGIENSNWFVTTTAGRYVLTLFERMTAQELPFHLGLLHRLAAHGIPCPDPVADRDGVVLETLMGKPAALCSRLDGQPEMQPGPAHCAQLGETIARMHLAAADYPGRTPNPRGLSWWQAVAPQLGVQLAPEQAALLADEIEHQRAFAAGGRLASLPASAVHADLFRDNVFFDARTRSPRLAGIIDFWFAGVDAWLFDLAVAANDWCTDENEGFDTRRLAALLDAYRRVRPLQPAEHDAWQTMLRAAALRFWVSRLYDLHCPRPAEIVVPKDPARFERILRLRRAEAPALH
ncbi:MAG: homoserine kinase [Burkholderiaceae bacterium]|nr:homoserine kinase [Burkholderiaceae bacterium]